MSNNIGFLKVAQSPQADGNNKKTHGLDSRKGVQCGVQPAHRFAQLKSAPQLEELAACGDPACNGCYDVGDGRKIHPPRTSQEYLEWLEKWEPTGTREQ